MSETFLTPEEVAELTGIKTGRHGKRREELQAEWLRTSGIPFWVNARGRPIIPRTAIEGAQVAVEKPKQKWQPRALNPGRCLEQSHDDSLRENSRWTLPPLKERRKRSLR